MLNVLLVETNKNKHIEKVYNISQNPVRQYKH